MFKELLQRDGDYEPLSEQLLVEFSQAVSINLSLPRLNEVGLSYLVLALFTILLGSGVGRSRGKRGVQIGATLLLQGT